MIKLCLISDTLIYQISNLLIKTDDLEDRHIKYNIALFNHHNYDILNMYSYEDYPDMELFIRHLFFTEHECDCYVLFRGVLHSIIVRHNSNPMYKNNHGVRLSPVHKLNPSSEYIQYIICLDGNDNEDRPD